MKKVILSVIVLLWVVSSYSMEINEERIPRLVFRTLKVKLRKSDFCDKSKLVLNVDTLYELDKKSIWDFDYYKFETKKEFISQFSTLKKFFKNKKIEKFITLNDNSLFDGKRHWILLIKEDEIVYKIDWWFSEYDETKLSAITICRLN